MQEVWQSSSFAQRTRKAQLCTLDTVSAGLHCSFKMSKQMLPLLLIFGWYTLVWKFTCKFTSVNKGANQHCKQCDANGLYTLGGLKG